MDLIDSKKIFSVGLAVSTLFSGVASANGDWNKERAKDIAKKSAPYVAAGVPTAVLLTTLIVLAVKNREGKANQQQPTEPNPSTQQVVNGSGKSSHSDTTVGGSGNSSRPSHPSAPAFSPCTPQEIYDALQKCELPGIRFWIVKAPWFGSQKSDYYFYTITDLSLAKKYFASLGDQSEVNTVVMWQNHSVYEKDFDKIFESSPKFKEHFSQVIKQKKFLVDHATYESGDLPHQNIGSGCPVILNGMVHYDEMNSKANKVVCGHINERFVVPTPEVAAHTHEVAAPKKIATSDNTPVVSDGTTQSKEKGPKDSAKQGGDDPSDKLKQEILSSGTAVGETAVEEVVKDHEDGMHEKLEKGCLAGFKFYRYEPGGIYSTRHCYIITDYNAAKASLGITDDNDEAWKKVVLYQNRWLDKHRDKKWVPGSNGGWSFEALFGFGDNTFGGYFDKITSLSGDKRQGSETLKSLPAGCKSDNFGRCVFERADSRLGSHSDKILGIICPVPDGNAIAIQAFIDQNKEFQFKD